MSVQSFVFFAFFVVFLSVASAVVLVRLVLEASGRQVVAVLFGLVLAIFGSGIGFLVSAFVSGGATIAALGVAMVFVSLMLLSSVLRFERGLDSRRSDD